MSGVGNLTCEVCGAAFHAVYRPETRKHFVCGPACYYRKLHPTPDLNATCEQCGKAFVCHHTKPKTRFCGDRCASLSRLAAKHGDLTCERCGATFHRRSEGAAGRFCSRACAFAQQSDDARNRPPKVVVPEPQPLRPCRFCGCAFRPPFGGGAFCSNSCRDANRKMLNAADWRKRHPRFVGPCHRCGGGMVTRRGDVCRTCGDELKREWKRNAKRVRRAAARGAEAERVERAVLLSRDGHRCSICRVRVRTAGDVTHPHYANVDHIIPLSRGGPHTYANCQILCRQCNMEKSDRIDGAQLRFA